MARITRVKKAQQRYETVPVLDETGQPKKVPVMKNGQQRMTRTKAGRPGRPIFMTLTRADKTKPLPPEKCGRCRKEITPGTPYKHISPKSGPYGGRRLVRCADCPDWHVWEYSSSLSAQLAQIAHDFNSAVDDATEPGDVEQALQEAAEAIRGIAEEKEQSASNIEDGFGHPTQMSEELAETAQSLNDWADEVENTQVPELPDPEDVQRWYVINGQDDTIVFEDTPEGWEEQEEASKALHDFLAQKPELNADDFAVVERDYTPEELSDDELEAWRDEVRGDCSVVDEAPV